MIPTTTYVAAICAIIVLASLGAMLRVLAIRRARARCNAFAVPLVPAYGHPPTQPPQNFGQNPYYPQPWTTPPPTLTSPAFPQPPSSSYQPPPAAYARGQDPMTSNLSLNPPSQPNQATQPISQPIPLPPLVGEKQIPLEQMTLADRMHEVQTLMIEIRRLESDPGPNHRTRIQELQRRVTELSDTQNPNVSTSVQVIGPPPAYTQDARGPT